MTVKCVSKCKRIDSLVAKLMKLGQSFLDIPLNKISGIEKKLIPMSIVFFNGM